MKAIAYLLCAVCLLMVMFAAIGGASGGLTLTEARALASLGGMLGLLGAAIDGRLERRR